MKNKLLYKTYYNKKVLVTGHTGFKGTWLTIWLKLLGAEVMGISLDIPSKPSHFEKSNISKSRVRGPFLSILTRAALFSIFRSSSRSLL